MPAYKGTKELPKPSNKQARMMFTSMQKDREGMAKGRPDSVQRGEKGEVASMKKYAAAGIVKKLPTAKQMGNLGMAKGAKVTSKMADKAGRALVKKSADTMGRAMVKKAGGGKCYASGGLVGGHKSADGIAKKGKTKGTEVKMARGGATAIRGPRMDFAGVQRKKGGKC
jgi:hypothetical protein